MKTTARFQAIESGGRHWLLIAALVVGPLGCGPSEDIFTACEAGHAEAVERLLHGEPALLHAKNSSGLTPLHTAAFGGHAEIVELLVKMGADINVTDNSRGLTPLHLASQNAQVRVVSLLVSHGARVDARLDSGETSLYLAAQGSCFSVRPVKWARGQMLDIAKVLVAAGADVNGRRNDGSMPIHNACRYGNAAMLEFLLGKGASANADDGAGFMPLHYLAASTENGVTEASLIETAKILLADGAGVNQRDGFGRTPAEEALKSDKKNLASMLQHVSTSAR